MLVLTECYLNTLSGGSSLLGPSRVVKPSPLLMLLPGRAGARQGGILGGVLGGCWVSVTAEYWGNTRDGHLIISAEGRSQLCPALPFGVPLFCPSCPQSPEQPPLLRPSHRRCSVSLCREQLLTPVPGAHLDKPLGHKDI